MRLTIILISSLIIFNSCQLLQPLQKANEIDIYPLKTSKIKFQQEWQISLYHKRISDFRKLPIGFKKIVFLGNSITEGAKSWNKKLDQKNLVNRGISGDITEGVLARLGEIYYYKPLGVFLLIGINDIFDSNIENRDKITPNYVANNIIKIAKNIERYCPYTKIYIQTILPVDLLKYKEIKGTAPTHEISLNDQINKINNILKNNTNTYQNIEIIDLHNTFKNEQGILNPDLSHDGIHLNDLGYDIWVKTIKKTVIDLNSDFLN